RLEVSCIPMAPKIEVNSGCCQPPSANRFAVNHQILEFVKEKALSSKPPRACLIADYGILALTDLALIHKLRQPVHRFTQYRLCVLLLRTLQRLALEEYLREQCAHGVVGHGRRQGFVN